MSDPDALISTEALARQLGRDDLRIYDCTTYLEPTPPGSDDPYIAVPGAAPSRRRTFPAPISSTCRASSPTSHAAALHDAAGSAAGGRVRPSRPRPGTRASCSTASARMMWATRFWWMLRSLGFDGAAVLDGGFDKWKAEGRPTESGPAKGYPPATLQGRAAAGPLRRQARRAGRDGGARHRDRQRARAAVPQGAGAQPLRPAGTRPRQRQRAGGDAGRSGRKDFTALADAEAKFAARASRRTST